MKEVQLSINDKLYSFKKDTTILQACTLANIEIPRFCYYEKLSIAGNCRACLVEVVGLPKPVASCAMPISDNMIVNTETNLVKKARENVLEMLLINHPLDCPICDQGGECDLQDLALIYGSDISKFNEKKYAIANPNIGPKIKTHMTRCIYCTRCVRFGTEIIGKPSLGTIGRGVHSEISTYINNIVDSEISGNIIDLCPVGALTSKVSAYSSRSWELKKVSCIDIFDSMGSNILVHTKNNLIIKVTPRSNEKINQEWITDKVRFNFEGIFKNRLNNPLFRKSSKEEFEKISWLEAFSILKKKLINIDSNKILGIVNGWVEAESLLLFKKLLISLNSKNKVSNEKLIKIKNNYSTSYKYMTDYKNLLNNDVIILIGLNLKIESPIFNIRLTESIKLNNSKVIKIGNYTNNIKNDNILQISLNIDSLLQIIEGRHPIVQLLINSKNPCIIISNNVYANEYSNIINYFIDEIKKKIKIDLTNINILQNHINETASLDININNNIDNFNYNILYLFNSDLNLSNKYYENKFVIYQGHHGDEGSKRANLILPTYTHLEQDGIYVNNQGIAQKSYKVLNNTYNAKNNINILLAISKYLKKDIDLTKKEDIDKYLKNYIPSWLELNEKRLFNYKKIKDNKNIIYNYNYKKINNIIYSYNGIKNYYLMDCISKFSKVMRESSKY